MVCNVITRGVAIAVLCAILVSTVIIWLRLGLMASVVRQVVRQLVLTVVNWLGPPRAWVRRWNSRKLLAGRRLTAQPGLGNGLGLGIIGSSVSRLL